MKNRASLSELHEAQDEVRVDPCPNKLPGSQKVLNQLFSSKEYINPEL